MSTDLALVDSNVLVYAFYQEAQHHASARGLLDRAQRREGALCVAPQNLAEFYAVITDPRRVAGPRKAAEAADAIARMLVMPGMSVLPVPADLVPRWLELARRHPIKGGAIFDLQLVATMLANGVSRIYTYDRSHFEPFPEIEVLTP